MRSQMVPVAGSVGFCTFYIRRNCRFKLCHTIKHHQKATSNAWDQLGFTCERRGDHGVNPAANSIFDLAGNIAITNQSNNSATLNDKLGCNHGHRYRCCNATVDVTLAEAYPGVPNSGYSVEDWVLSILDTNSTTEAR